MSPGDQPSSQPDLRAALAVGHRFALELLAEMPSALAPTDAVLLLSIAQANAGALSRLQQSYSRIDDPPPSELQRPVSILSIADAMRLPFETTRRRIRRLAAAGLCEVSRTGCRISPAVVTGSGYAAIATRAWSMLDQLCADLGAAGVAPRHWMVGRYPLADRSPARLVARILGDYMLRTVASAAPQDGDVVDRLIVMGAHGSSVRRGLHVRMSSAYLARSIGSDAETTRRRLEVLRTSGLVERGAGGGWRTPMGAHPAIDAAANDHLVSARRCLTELRRADVLRLSV